jgi:thiol-disulfide isomerase/thioredoxin
LNSNGTIKTQSLFFSTLYQTLNPQLNIVDPKPKRSTSAFIPLMAAALFMVTGICGLLFIGRDKARILGQTITELDIQPLLNTEKPLKPEDLEGKVVVLHFWGWWCPPCVAEYPEIAMAQKKFVTDSEVVFASIACGETSDDSQDAVSFRTKQFLNKIGEFDLPVYCDPVEYSRTQISQLMTRGGFSYPTTLVVDSRGRVVEVWRSKVTAAMIEQAVVQAKKSK